MKTKATKAEKKWVITTYQKVIVFFITAISFVIGMVLCQGNSGMMAIDCIDGDTFAINGISYRLAWIDAPEVTNKKYSFANDFTCQYLHENDIRITSTGLDKYGRTLAIVNRPYFGTKTLNELLIENCLAKPYYRSTTDRILNSYEQNCQ